MAEPITSVECDVSNQGMLEQVDTQVSGSAISRLVISLASSPLTAGTSSSMPSPRMSVRMSSSSSKSTHSADDHQTMSLATMSSSDLGYQAELPGGLFDPVYTIRSSGGNPITAVEMGVNETINFIMQTYLTLDRVFRGSVQLSSSSPSESSIWARVSWTGDSRS